MPDLNHLTWILFEGPESVDARLQVFLAEAAKLLDASGATLFVRLNGSDTFALAAQLGDDSCLPWSASFRLGERVAGSVAESGEAVLLNGPSDHPALRGAGMIARRRVGSALIVPIKTPTECVGVLNFSRKSSEKTFSDGCLQFSSRIARKSAPGIAHIRQLARLQESASRALSANRFAAVLDNLRIAVFTFDASGRLVDANREAFKLVNRSSRRRATWEELAERLPEGLAQEIRQLVLKRPRGEKLLESNGRFFRVSVSGLKGFGSSCFVEEITKQREQEQELARISRLAEIGQMTAAIAHEIRNPLTSIRGAAQILQSEDEVGRARAWGRVIEEEADTLNRLCDGFLDFARPLVLLRRQCEINEILQRIEQTSSAEAQASNISLRVVRVQDGTSTYLDPEKFIQAIRNLIRNAIDAMPNGGELVVESQIIEQELFVTVTDTGMGIPNQDLDKLFTPFFTTKPSGTGLGLSNVQRIIEAHGGKIEVKSNRSGTVFSIRIPIGMKVATAA